MSDPKQLLCDVDYQFVALTHCRISVLLVSGRSTRDIVFLLSFIGLFSKLSVMSLSVILLRYWSCR